MEFARHTTRALVLLALSVGAGRLDAQQQITQTVRIEVVAVNHAAATAAALPVASRATSAAATRGTLSLTTNEANQKISASLDRPLPAGMMLSVAISAPGAESAGRTTLSAATANDVVTSLPTGDTKSMPVQFVVTGGEATSRTVTYTVVGAP